MPCALVAIGGDESIFQGHFIFSVGIRYLNKEINMISFHVDGAEMYVFVYLNAFFWMICTIQLAISAIP
jgi:hypothetical protein